MSEKTTSKYPSEVIDLPSKGMFYSTDHPLSSGTIEIKYMTAREEDILSSTNLINKGIVLDKLVESLIVSDVNPDDLLVGDKNAIILAARIMSFGSDYNVTVTCPKCFERQPEEIDLSQIEPKELNFNAGNKNIFEFTLPSSKVKVTYRHITHGIEKKIEEDIKAYEKIRGKSDVNRRRSTEYRYIITSVNGDHNPSHISEFVENELIIKDARALISEIQKNDPDMDTTFNFTCNSCKHSDRLEVPIDVSFLWPPN